MPGKVMASMFDAAYEDATGFPPKNSHADLKDENNQFFRKDNSIQPYARWCCYFVDRQRAIDVGVAMAPYISFAWPRASYRIPNLVVEIQKTGYYAGKYRLEAYVAAAIVGDDFL